MFYFYYLGVLVMIVFILQAVAFLTLLERHLLGGSQCRIGPNKVSYNGLLQAVFDGFKLMKKEQLLPYFSSFFSFLFVPLFAFIIMVFFWFTLPYFFSFIFFEYSGLFLLCVMAFSVYPVMLSGVFSNSNYSFVGGLRSSSQSYSYEIAFSLYLLIFFVFNKGLFLFFNFNFIFFFFLLPWIVMILGDLHRAPFDFSEGESEWVSGFKVKYSSVGLVSLFLGEYGNMLYFSCWVSGLFLKMSFFVFYYKLFVIVFSRISNPRFRFEKLSNLCGLNLLPWGFYFLGLYYVVFVMNLFSLKFLKM
uniref:NADH-ubiquinone oxidoreductase chain 1 n=1 Tax=Spirocerca lupi TaxID=304461 RepID=M9QFW5_9BILA|nr:NADH dehydrogenase subunit 1 [Spirocerca lupi]AGI51582.1 NADH dehydrogenase subunit 1 [Spirocerca lupi]